MSYIRNEEVDITILCKAALTYYNALQMHLKGTHPLSQETIKYYVDSLLEITLNLEDLSKDIYDSLSDEEKKALELAEMKRNEFLYTDCIGKPRPQKDMQTIKACIDASSAHYDEVREEAKSKINHS